MAIEGHQYLSSLLQWKGTPDFDLRNMRALMDSMGNPQNDLKSIHVAGTNGKGSVSATISAILGASGARVGMNISPHLAKVNERIVIDGLPIDDDSLSRFAAQVKLHAEKTGLRLSMHEGITAISFVAFKELGLDWMVMEVGLGGRLDASNVLKRPEASAIVTIDFDHEHILGSTLTEIAREKAGIIKENGLVVVGDVGMDAQEEIRRIAGEKHAEVFSYGSDYSCFHISDSATPNDLDRFQYNSPKKNDDFTVIKSLRGQHQVANAGVAIAVARSVGASVEECQSGCKSVFWPGRLEVIHWQSRMVLIDCAHNPHGVRALVDNLKRWDLSGITCAFGVLDTKNWRTMVELLVPYVAEWNILTPDSDRALPAEEISRHLSGIGVSSRSFGTDYATFFAAAAAQNSGPLLLTGSMYLIGNIRHFVGAGERPIWVRQ